MTIKEKNFIPVTVTGRFQVQVEEAWSWNNSKLIAIQDFPDRFCKTRSLPLSIVSKCNWPRKVIWTCLSVLAQWRAYNNKGKSNFGVLPEIHGQVQLVIGGTGWLGTVYDFFRSALRCGLVLTGPWKFSVEHDLVVILFYYIPMQC